MLKTQGIERSLGIKCSKEGRARTGSCRDDLPLQGCTEGPGEL